MTQSDFDAALDEVERLREAGKRFDGLIAQRIKELEAEVERLKAELAGSKESLRGHVEGVRSWQERAEKAEAMLKIANDKLVECGDVCDKQQAEVAAERERRSINQKQVDDLSRDWVAERERAEKAEAEAERLRAALGEASMSMETIADAAGSRDGLLLEMSQVRGYARNRAAVARAALRGEKEK